ncbi:trypsin-like peptidase domain-containing protein [Streptomyces sp. KMM 9044]|uniref:trypsin-like peptidase domain-containing protein n=1 Tax=Streptomyces sp. KMM 9044 TaxID=2744474 RepID=UPI0022B236A7|nr:trypsin-like peptidase domain-containing protein [Streptomyces sp. KMM 9044]WAX78100.1 trypsin-like peptidase domain-containing protein [Streptomyces sp. KMM 9044]
MNEGKPPKAGPSGEQEQPDGPGGDGDFELERPAPSGGSDDFELARPATPPADTGDDYELHRPPSAGTRGPGLPKDVEPAGAIEPRESGVAPEPARPATSAEPAGAVVSGAPGESAGAIEPRESGVAPEPARPATSAEPAGAVVSGAPGEPAGAIEPRESGVAPEPARPATSAEPAGAVVSGAPGESAGAIEPRESGVAPEPARPAGAGLLGGRSEQPRPLHDPDPYSTPPYGEPGPWASAPPVQRPAATPVQDTSVPVPSPEPGALPHGMPAPAAPAPHAPDASHSATVPAPAAPAVFQAQDAPAADAQAPADPWRRYDPWAAVAASAPLQQTGGVVATEGQRRKRAKRTLAGFVLVVALVSGSVGGIVGTQLERNGGVGSVELPQAEGKPAGRDPGSIAGIAAQALPSVVTLHVSGASSAGTGTGFVLDDRGHILTNDHVVQPAGRDGEITVTFHSGDTAEATVVGRDSGYDLAVVKVKGVSRLAPLPLGNSDNVQVGDPVVAIGAPFDLAGTVTAGIISARERPITAGGGQGDGSDVSYVDALQTDAPINPGNSGGPLLDAEGHVIGINSAIRSAGSGGGEAGGGQAGSIGLGFAIPVNQGKRVAEELINTGRATHPVIGITLDMDYAGDGARVGARGSDGGPPVSSGGPGDKAGIRAGDVITKVDGQRVHSGEELIVKTRAHRPGDRLELTLERDGTEREVSLVLGSSGGD